MPKKTTRKDEDETEENEESINESDEEEEKSEEEKSEENEEEDSDEDDVEEEDKEKTETEEARVDTCLYNFKGQQSVGAEIFDDDLYTNYDTHEKKIVNVEDRITRPILTKYERVRILAERRQQLVLGAKPMIRVSDKIPEKEIASLELKAKVIPFIIVRTLPNGNVEHWQLSELDIVN